MITVAQWGVKTSLTQRERLGCQFPAGDEAAQGQAVDIQKPGNDGLRDPLLEVFPDHILLAGEFGLPGQAAFWSS